MAVKKADVQVGNTDYARETVAKAERQIDEYLVRWEPGQTIRIPTSILEGNGTFLLPLQALYPDWIVELAPADAPGESEHFTFR